VNLAALDERRLASVPAHRRIQRFTASQMYSRGMLKSRRRSGRSESSAPTAVCSFVQAEHGFASIAADPKATTI
jgi:hypothetical protein